MQVYRFTHARIADDVPACERPTKFLYEAVMDRFFNYQRHRKLSATPKPASSAQRTAAPLKSERALQQSQKRVLDYS